jgi:hypothetical protein
MSAASGSPRHAVNNLRRVHGASPNASQAKSCNTAHGCFKCGKCDATVSWPCSGKWCFCWMASSVCNHWTFSSKRPGVNITYMYLAVCQRRVCKKATSAAILFVHKARVGLGSSHPSTIVRESTPLMYCIHVKVTRLRTWCGLMTRGSLFNDCNLLSVTCIHSSTSVTLRYEKMARVLAHENAVSDYTIKHLNKREP